MNRAEHGVSMVENINAYTILVQRHHFLDIVVDGEDNIETDLIECVVMS
jgi:hypothetical protein